MVRPTSRFLSLTFKCQSTAAVLVSHLAVAGRTLWYRVCPSFPPEICQDRSWDFSGFCNKLETLMKLCMTAWFFEKRFLLQKLRKWPKNSFSFNLKRKLKISFHWTCSIMKMFITYCVPTQIPYLEKILFLRYRPKCSQPIRLHGF